MYNMRPRSNSTIKRVMEEPNRRRVLDSLKAPILRSHVKNVEPHPDTPELNDQQNRLSVSVVEQQATMDRSVSVRRLPKPMMCRLK